ncbi:MAG: phenylalanine--tRNA ligase subunit beta [Acidobacteriota bacterium]
MPIVNIDLDWLNRLLGRDFPPQEISESLEQIGCDVEEVVEVTRSRCPGCQALLENPVGQNEIKTCGFCGHSSETPFQTAGAVKVVRLDLLAARPDLFDVGGLARALRGTLGILEGLPDYQVRPSGLRVEVDPSVRSKESYRPYICCAVMTLPEIDETSLVAIMKLQESLHWGVGRDRKLASIGIYDLDSLTGDIRYRTLDPDHESFFPLGSPNCRMTGRQILNEHPKGLAYAHLLEGYARYPLLVDGSGQVLSMPPIINSEETRLQMGTRRVFIDITGLSQAAVRKTLNTLVSSLMEMGGETESVQIHGLVEGIVATPDLTPGETIIDLVEARRWLGLPLDETSLMGALRKMRLDVELVPGAAGSFKVRYPAYRTDIRHMVDVFEDIAIGYGYANIEARLVPSLTIGRARAEELLTERVRQVLTGLGFSEIMSLPLTTEEDHFERLRMPVPENYPKISNPKLKSHKVVRTHLMTGLVESLYENRRRPMPLRLFEVDNVVELDPETETRTCEERRVAFVEMGREAGYAGLRSLLDALLRELGFGGKYFPIDHPSFVAGRAASVDAGKPVTGILGEVHPEVLVRFGLDHPVAIAEVTLFRIF